MHPGHFAPTMKMLPCGLSELCGCVSGRTRHKKSNSSLAVADRLPASQPLGRHGHQRQLFEMMLRFVLVQEGRLPVKPAAELEHLSCQVAVDYADELANIERLRDRLGGSAG